MRVTMLGTGAYGLALSLSLAKNKNNEVIMWSENSTIVNEFNQTHRFDRIFEGMEIPSNISITNNYAESLNDSDLIFIGCAAKYVGGLCSSIKDYYDGTTPICIASKGIEEQTGSFLSELVKNTLKTDKTNEETFYRCFGCSVFCRHCFRRRFIRVSADRSQDISGRSLQLRR